MLKKAIVDSLSVVGRASVDVLLEELKRQGMDLDRHDRTHTLDELEQMLVAIFGHDITPLMMKKINALLKK